MGSSGIELKELDFAVEESAMIVNLQIIRDLLLRIIETLDDYEDRLTAGGH